MKNVEQREPARPRSCNNRQGTHKQPFRHSPTLRSRSPTQQASRHHTAPIADSSPPGWSRTDPSLLRLGRAHTSVHAQHVRADRCPPTSASLRPSPLPSPHLTAPRAGTQSHVQPPRTARPPSMPPRSARFRCMIHAARRVTSAHACPRGRAGRPNRSLCSRCPRCSRLMRTSPTIPIWVSGWSASEP